MLLQINLMRLVICEGLTEIPRKGNGIDVAYVNYIR